MDTPPSVSVARHALVRGLDGAELEHRARETKSTKLEGTLIALSSLADVAVALAVRNAWVLLAAPVLAVATWWLTRRVEIWWARYHRVPLAMYAEQVVKYRREASETGSLLQQLITTADDLATRKGDAVREPALNAGFWMVDWHAFLRRVEEELKPKLAGSEHHKLLEPNYPGAHFKQPPVTELYRAITRLKYMHPILRELLLKYEFTE